MGKALAAWMMMLASVVAAPTAGPRQTVETATLRVIGVLQPGGPGGRSEIDRRQSPAHLSRIVATISGVAEA